MKKLRIEELHVESFVTSDQPHERGSVQAHQDEAIGIVPADGGEDGGSAAYETCKQTCPYTCVYTQDPRQCPPLM